MPIMRTSKGAVPTAAPKLVILVSWRCICHHQRFERSFPQEQGREARQFAVNLKRNDSVYPLTVHVHD